jgi:hypothetical protein
MLGSLHIQADFFLSQRSEPLVELVERGATPCSFCIKILNCCSRRVLADSYHAEPTRAARKALNPTGRAQIALIKPELVTFFGCLYYAALRPEEAVGLLHDDLVLPAHGRGASSAE